MPRTQYFAASFLAFLLSFGLVSCETDFDLNAEYQEIPVIYGFIDSDTVYQRFKVSKAFQNEDDIATRIASHVPDSTRYGDEMVVRLIETNSLGVEQPPFPLTPEIITDKDPGLFFSENERVYSTVLATQPDASSSFRIVAENTNTGKVATSTTRAVGDFEVTSPFRLTFSLPDEDNSNPRTNISWRQPANGEIFDLVAFIHYYNKSTNETYMLKWNVVSGIRSTGGNVTAQVAGANFFDFMLQNVTHITTEDYVFEKISFEVTAGSSDFLNYITISRNFSAVTQVRPEYSNINGGRGLFAARNKAYRSYLATYDNNGPVSTSDFAAKTINALYNLNIGFTNKP